MTDTSHPSIQLVERLVNSIERGDLATLNSCFAPGARIWHNNDQKTLSVEENAAGATYLFENFPKRDYKVRRYELLSNGVLLQFTTGLRNLAGKEFDWSGCIVCAIGGEGITLLEEYIDAGSMAG